MNQLRRRRFVNIVSENYKSATCSLHRLDVSDHLFYPSTAEAEAEAEADHQAAANKPVGAAAMISESRVLWRSPEGVTVVYDADDSNCSHAMTSLAYKGCNPVTISIPRRNADAEDEGEDLYVMSASRNYPTFQVLTFGGRRTYKSPWRRSHRDKPWQWDSLPPPPLPQGFVIRSHAVLDDGDTVWLCVTAIYCGPEEKPALTCLFDTARREWRRQATATGGGSHLPFWGGAEYVSDLKLWLGFCRDDDEHQLCAYDLSAAAAAGGAGEPPTLKHRIGELVEMPKEWESMEPRLVNLGDGRFCLARIMQDVWDDDEEDGDHHCCCSDLFVSNRGRMLAVLTGVEMVRGEEEGFKMVAHKSFSYMFDKDRILCVL